MVPRVVKITEAESRMVVVGVGERGVESCLMAQSCSFTRWKELYRWMIVMVAHYECI